MKFTILAVKNRLTTNVVDDLEDFASYIETFTPMKVEYTVVESDFALAHKEFIKRADGTALYGLDGVKEQVRTIGLLEPYLYHACVFLYDLDETGWRDTAKKRIAHWTYFNEIVPGTEFIEVATRRKWDVKKDTFRVLTHEFFHAAHNRCRRQGVLTRDTMDCTPVAPDAPCVPYYKDHDVFAEDGNRARNLAELAPHWQTVAARPGLLTFLRLLELTVAALGVQVKLRGLAGVNRPNPAPEEPERSRLDEWAEAIKQFEGWYPGSRSYRNNNPGNLRWSKFQIGTAAGFAVFPDYATGMRALKFQLEIAATGKSRVYRPTHTLTQFFTIYAPSSDGNHPAQYANFVASKLGMPVGTQIKELVA